MYMDDLKAVPQVVLNWIKKVALCLPSAGRRTRHIHLSFTQPGAHLLQHPCKIFESVRNEVIAAGGKQEWSNFMIQEVLSFSHT